MIDSKALQTFLKTGGFYLGNVDGIFGPQSVDGARQAILQAGVNCRAWPNDRIMVGINQLFLNRINDAGLLVDGLPGARTNDALYVYNTTQLHSISKFWPRQADVRSGRSMFGKPGTGQGMVECPYTMWGDYERKIKVTHFQAHAAVVPAIERILKNALTHYGLPNLQKLNLDIFSGCYNYRKTTGGSALSMHAWGIGVDIDAAHNQMDEANDEAAFAKPIYAPFLDMWEEEGAVSLGRARNYDWMHFQFSRL